MAQDENTRMLHIMAYQQKNLIKALQEIILLRAESNQVDNTIWHDIALKMADIAMEARLEWERAYDEQV